MPPPPLCERGWRSGQPRTVAESRAICCNNPHTESAPRAATHWAKTPRGPRCAGPEPRGRLSLRGCLPRQDQAPFWNMLLVLLAALAALGAGAPTRALTFPAIFGNMLAGSSTAHLSVRARICQARGLLTAAWPRSPTTATVRPLAAGARHAQEPGSKAAAPAQAAPLC